MVQRKILLLQMVKITIYVCSPLHEKTEFCKNVKFSLVPYAFHYGSCFNATLSCYTF